MAEIRRWKSSPRSCFTSRTTAAIRCPHRLEQGGTSAADPQMGHVSETRGVGIGQLTAPLVPTIQALMIASMIGSTSRRRGSSDGSACRQTPHSEQSHAQGLSLTSALTICCIGP
jgi:hypothetical protein